MSNEGFMNLCLGCSKPTPVETIKVEVEISDMNLFSQYARGFVIECSRCNPLKFDKCNLTPEKMETYVRFIIQERVKLCSDQYVKTYRLKMLYIPCWLEKVIQTIGRVEMRDIGLTLLPKLPEDWVDIDFDKDGIADIAEEVGAFEEDVEMVHDAFFKKREGDKDVMSCALIANYVRAIKPVQHVVSTYIAAFAGFKVSEAMSLAILYRISYDDVNFIQDALMHTRDIFH